jgi:hypothetical protein
MPNGVKPLRNRDPPNALAACFPTTKRHPRLESKPQHPTNRSALKTLPEVDVRSLSNPAQRPWNASLLSANALSVSPLVKPRGIHGIQVVSGTKHDSETTTAVFQEDRMIRRTLYTGLFSIAALTMTANLALAQGHTSKPFTGAKVNAGTVTHSMKDGKNVLTLSDDFKVPDTPDPHWQIVDSKGNTYLLQRLNAKNLGGLAKDRLNMSITLPAYVKDVAKVQIYCAWAEAVLGDAPFAAPLMTLAR